VGFAGSTSPPAPGEAPGVYDLDRAARLRPDRARRHPHRRVPAVRVTRRPTRARGRRGADRPHGGLCARRRDDSSPPEPGRLLDDTR